MAPKSDNSKTKDTNKSDITIWLVVIIILILLSGSYFVFIKTSSDTLSLKNDSMIEPESIDKSKTELMVPTKQCKVYTYQDNYNYGIGRHCLDKVTIKSVYFVARNQISGIKPYWKDNMLDIFTQIKMFYVKEFDNKINISIDEPIIIYGERNIEQYSQLEIEQEIRSRIIINTTADFTVLMFYPIQGENNRRVFDLQYGGGNEVRESSSAMNSWFWLDPESLGTITTKYGTDYSGYLGSAHEFSHALGIPHPWEEESNRDKNSGMILDQNYGNDEEGSLMSYGGQEGPLTEKSFIREEVKEKMIVN